MSEMPSNEFVCRACRQPILVPTPPEEMSAYQREFVAAELCGEALAGVE